MHCPPTHLVYAAFCDSLDLYSQGLPSWIGDIAVMLNSLDVPVQFPAPALLLTEGAVERMIAAVDKSRWTWMRDAVQSSPRLQLVRHRLEPSRHAGTAKGKTNTGGAVTMSARQKAAEEYCTSHVLHNLAYCSLI